MAGRTRLGGKNKKRSFKLRDDQDLVEATRYALSAAYYHCSEIRSYRDQLLEDDAWADGAFTDKGREGFNKLYHNVRAFFWELIAAFDTLLQEINRRLKLGLDEREVDWTTISLALSTKRELRRFRRQLNVGYNSPWFADVREWRNFAHIGTISAETVGWSNDADPTVRLRAVQLRPHGTRRGGGDPLELCKYYGTSVQEFVRWALEELERIAPSAGAEGNP